MNSRLEEMLWKKYYESNLKELVLYYLQSSAEIIIVKVLYIILLLHLNSVAVVVPISGLVAGAADAAVSKCPVSFKEIWRN